LFTRAKLQMVKILLRKKKVPFVKTYILDLFETEFDELGLDFVGATALPFQLKRCKVTITIDV